jgi:membrane protein DedA with SNARE-associated domain
VAARLKWIVTALALFALVGMPFILFEGEILELSVRLFEPGGLAAPVAALAIFALFAGDVVLPVPSSLVSIAAVALFGWAGGLLIWAGMSAGCALGYWLGGRAARPLARRYLGRSELERARRVANGIGPATIVLTRAVPVLAEAATVGAGLAAMPLGRFAAAAGLANAGIALVYVAAGTGGSFLLLFAAAAALPAAGWVMLRIVRFAGETRGAAD